ncbi:MAG: hypothetical protein AB1483_10885 [Candidatus Zixiibacteriota bacterium]
MNRLFTKAAIRITTVLLVAILTGCSDNTITNVISADDWVAGTESTAYLPLAEGYTTIYSVEYSDGTDDMVTLEVGRQVQLAGISAVEWFSTSGDGLDTGYVHATSDAVYFYESASASPEKILEMPLLLGNSWSRFTDIYIDDQFIDIITDYDKDDVDGTEGTAKTFPSSGGDIMTVAGSEGLRLGDGTYYSGAVKIYNASETVGKTNYYWFVANVGLVKYVIGATDSSYPDGDIVGELISSGY